MQLVLGMSIWIFFFKNKEQIWKLRYIPGTYYFKKKPFSNYESPSRRPINNQFYTGCKKFLCFIFHFSCDWIYLYYTTILQIWKKSKTPFVRLILISHVQSIAYCCFKFLEVEVNGPKLDSRYLEWVYVNK